MSGTKAFRSQLAVTIGDPAGIGPEVVLKALADQRITAACEVTVIGSHRLLVRTYQQLRSLHPTLALANPDHLTIWDLPLDADQESQIILGQGNAASGAASFSYLETAIAAAVQGKFQGIVTGPIAKSAWKAAGHHYPGQTELLAEQAGVEQFGMLFVARSPHTGWMLRTLLATTHIPLRQVPAVLTPDLMDRKLALLLDCLQQDFGLDSPRIAIAGLNPHSGEQGQLGTEEQDWLIPWLEQARLQLPHIQLEGPIPPDTLWVKPGQAWFGLEVESGRTEVVEAETPLPNLKFATQNSKPSAQNFPIPTPDAYLALYHDQGLIPVKLMAFDRAVNTSVGLPFVRTSPDHGTAFDIADRGVASPTSMKAALELATELCEQRQRRLTSPTSAKSC